MKAFIYLCPVLLLTTGVWAQTCVDVPTSTERFIVNSDGTVSDSVTGLMVAAM